MAQSGAKVTFAITGKIIEDDGKPRDILVGVTWKKNPFTGKEKILRFFGYLVRPIKDMKRGEPNGIMITRVNKRPQTPKFMTIYRDGSGLRFA